MKAKIIRDCNFRESHVVSVPGARGSPWYGRQGRRPRGHCGSHANSRRYWIVRRRRRITVVVSISHTLYFGFYICFLKVCRICLETSGGREREAGLAREGAWVTEHSFWVARFSMGDVVFVLICCWEWLIWIWIFCWWSLITCIDHYGWRGLLF